METLMRASVQMPGEFLAEGEFVGPTLFQLDGFAGCLPLGPGDVLTLSIDGTPTGVESIKPQWIVELVARSPGVTQDALEWESARLSAEDMVEHASSSFTHMLRTTALSVLVSSPSWGKVDSFIRANPVVASYEIYRAGTVTQLDWASTVADPFGMERPEYDRSGHVL